MRKILPSPTLPIRAISEIFPIAILDNEAEESTGGKEKLSSEGMCDEIFKFDIHSMSFFQLSCYIQSLLSTFVTHSHVDGDISECPNSTKLFGALLWTKYKNKSYFDMVQGYKMWNNMYLIAYCPLKYELIRIWVKLKVVDSCIENVSGITESTVLKESTRDFKGEYFHSTAILLT